MELKNWMDSAYRDLRLEIRNKIAQRKKLNEKVKRSLEQMIVNLDGLVLRMRNPLRRSDLVDRKTQLEKEILRCQHEILQEEMRCWHDLAELEKELRAVVMEHTIVEDEN